MYNMTNITSANNAYEIVKATNQASSNILANLILFGLFLAILLVFKNYRFKYVLLADSFVITLLSIIVWVLEFTSWNIIIYPIVLLMVSLITALFTD